MADGCTVPLRQTNMKDSHSINNSPTDLCDDCPQEVKDELEPGYIEERFRVDRKKLEQMLQGNHLDQDEESAEEFFQRIMDETNTQITWPSKLKIGAKSKKDPHIKVIGYPEDVKSAKDNIMTILDTKSNRVTLKMDVSHTDHSHVIGKGGNNIKRVMHETGCHIHFPDSNRGNNVQEKSNQVSIAGQPIGVESARSQIRELLPLVFMFELPVTGVLQPLPDASSPMILQLQQQYNITISFRQRPRAYVTTVIVRGSVYNSKTVKEGTAKLMEHLLGNMAAPLPVSMQLEIAPQHHLFIIGRGGMNVKQIMQQTGASIHFPDPNNVTPQRKGTFYITGSIESVFLARQHLIGCLPLVLMFDVKDEIDMDQARITQLMEQLDVFISVKPKPKQPSKSVIVKSIERNAPNMYLARLTMLGLKKDDKNFPQTCRLNNIDSSLSPNNGLGLSALGFFGQNLLSVNTNNALLMLNGGHSSPTPLGSPQTTAVSSSAAGHWLPPPPGLYGPMMVLNPSDNISVQAQLDLIMQCGEGNQRESEQSSGYVTVSTQEQPAVANRNVSEVKSPNSSPRESPVAVLRRSGSAADIAALQSTNSFSKKVTRETSPCSGSAHTLDLLGLSKVVTSQQTRFMDSSLGRRSLENSLSRCTLQNGERSSESGAESDGSDKLAPGIEREKLNNAALFQSQLPLTADYEKRKLMANKAMLKKPEGESRIPTDFWSGMGFSKSMPEAAIRDKLNSKKFDQPYDSVMATTYESPNEGPGEDIDRDPWKDSAQNMNKPVNPAPGEYPSPRKKYDVSLSCSNYVDSACLPSMKNVTWSVKTDLAELFSKLGLGKYTDLFQQQEIDLSTFLTLTDQDLRELGISTFGARRKMLLAITDLNKARNILNADKIMSDNAPPGFGTRMNGNMIATQLNQQNQHMASRSIIRNHSNVYQDSDMPSPPQRAITGKQASMMYQDNDGSSLHNSSAGRGLLQGSAANLQSSGASLHSSQSNLHSSSASLHGSGHLSRNHYMDGNQMPRQITGGFSSSGSFQEGMTSGLMGRQITGGSLSASFQDKGSLPLQQHMNVRDLTASSSFIDSSPIIAGSSRHNSRSDLTSLGSRW